MRSAITRAAAATTALAIGLSTAAGAAQPSAGDTIELTSVNGRTTCQIVGDDYGWAGGAVCIHRAASGWPDGWFAISWPFWCAPTAWLSDPTGPAKIVLPDGCVFPGAAHITADGEQATSRDGWVSVLYGRGVVRSIFPDAVHGGAVSKPKKPNPHAMTQPRVCIRCEAPAVATYAGQPLCKTCAEDVA